MFDCAPRPKGLIKTTSAFWMVAVLQGRLYLHTGVTLVCNWLPLVMAAAMALVDSGQRPRPALLRLAFAGGAALTRVSTSVLIRFYLGPKQHARSTCSHCPP